MPESNPIRRLQQRLEERRSPKMFKTPVAAAAIAVLLSGCDYDPEQAIAACHVAAAEKHVSDSVQTYFKNCIRAKGFDYRPVGGRITYPTAPGRSKTPAGNPGWRISARPKARITDTIGFNRLPGPRHMRAEIAHISRQSYQCSA
jgi:entry exclusion lipoprotein TrbK